jgi:hypothetical protein
MQKDFPLMSQLRKNFSLHWAKKAERFSPYNKTNAERHSPDKGLMQNNIPLCWAHVEWSKTLNIYLSIFDKDVFNTFGTEM